MKYINSLRWPTRVCLAIVTLFAFACNRTTPMESADDAARYFDYAKALRNFPGLAPAQIQREIGSPDDIERTEKGRVLWHYERRFCEPDARCVYKHVTLGFDNDKLETIEPR